MSPPPTTLPSFLSPLHLSPLTLHLLTLSLSATYTSLALSSPSQFLATPINILPKGTETGEFLAIDVGGSNLRVGFIELVGSGEHEGEGAGGDHDGQGAGGDSREKALCEGDRGKALGEDVERNGNGEGRGGGKTETKRRMGKQRINRTHERSWSIEEHLKLDNADELFAWIGGCIAEVVGGWVGEKEKNGMGGRGKTVPLGITFSFPMIQSSIRTATLMPMGKGFAISSNLSLGKLLLAGYSQHLHSSTSTNAPPLPDIEIAAIANDSVATLASASYLLSSPTSNTRVAMGLIVATGANATTTLPVSMLSPSKTAPLIFPAPAHQPPKTYATTAGKLGEDRVVVNTEWGINGTAPPLRALSIPTQWDALLDAQTSAPGFQPFEYMTGGRYVGELARLILVDYFTTACAVPTESLPPRLLQRNALPTIFLSDKVARIRDPAKLLPMLSEAYPPLNEGDWTWTIDAVEAVLEVEESVMQRSAELTAAAVVGLLGCSGDVELREESDVVSSTTEEVEKKPVLVAYAGGVICQYPRYLERCQTAVDQIVEVLAPGYRVSLEEVADGGLIGAAVLAGTVWGSSD